MVIIEPLEDGGYRAIDTSTGLSAEGNTKKTAIENLYKLQNREYNIKLRRLWEKFKDNIIALIYAASKIIPVFKTPVHKLALFAREEGLFPYFTKNIHHHGHQSLDIERGLNELRNEGMLEIRGSVFKIPSGIPISLPQGYEEKIRNLLLRLGSEIHSLGNKSKEYYIEFLREDEYYHYASIRWIENEARRINERLTPHPLKKLKNVFQLVGKLAYEILEKKEDKEDHTFFVKDIKGAFATANWRKVKGDLCLQVGHIRIIDECEDKICAQFTNEAYSPEDYIRIVLDKNGIETDSRSLERNQYLLLGLIDEYRGEPIIRVATLVFLEEIPPDFHRSNFKEDN